MKNRKSTNSGLISLLECAWLLEITSVCVRACVCMCVCACVCVRVCAHMCVSIFKAINYNCAILILYNQLNKFAVKFNKMILSITLV